MLILSDFTLKNLTLECSKVMSDTKVLLVALEVTNDDILPKSHIDPYGRRKSAANLPNDLVEKQNLVSKKSSSWDTLTATQLKSNG